MAERTPTRDPFGLVPLYIDSKGRTSTQLGELLMESSRVLRHESVLEYVIFGEVTDPTATFFDDIDRVPPGHSVSSGQVIETWRLPEPAIVDRAPHALVSEFWSEFSAAVRRAIGSASEVTVPLSGGLDSAAIAAACVEQLGAASVHAVTEGKPGDEETRAAQQTARHLGIEQSLVSVDEEIVDWPQNPVWPTTPRTSSEVAWANVYATSDVVLWGVGGDSIQRGDRHHYRLRLRRGGVAAAIGDVARSVILHGRKPALGLRRALSSPPAAAPIPAWIAPDARAAAAAIALRRAAQTWRRGVDELLAPTWAYHFEWMAPAHNDPPARHAFPFFDVDLVALMATVPTAPWCVDKELLRAALRGRIPEAVRLRGKSPLTEPTMIGVSELWHRRLSAVLAQSDNSAWTPRALAAVIETGPQPMSRLMPALRGAAIQRWRAHLTDSTESSTLLRRISEGS